MSSNRTFSCSKYDLGYPDSSDPFGTDLIKVKNVRNCKTIWKYRTSLTFKFVQFPRRNLYLCISAFLRLFCGTNFKNKNSSVEGLTFPTWLTNSYSKDVFYSGQQDALAYAQIHPKWPQDPRSYNIIEFRALKIKLWTVNKNEQPYWHDFVSGYVGGACGVIIGHPFDTVKIRLQTRGHLYNSGRDAFRKIY